MGNLQLSFLLTSVGCYQSSRLDGRTDEKSPLHHCVVDHFWPGRKLCVELVSQSLHYKFECILAVCSADWSITEPHIGWAAIDVDMNVLLCPLAWSLTDVEELLCHDRWILWSETWFLRAIRCASVETTASTRILPKNTTRRCGDFSAKPARACPCAVVWCANFAK